ncbi:hypothetical protein CEUSTIGMA_g13154.t1 [Chlamydomonas eustigma]|uniref:Uncharacterized protein n=1 Tax=Chlamydomonas eustigma TaxID=1157962 RepID=A0A250XS17_9CHLO|nr:hypothetical protein CEUSTIGMA_g13154.t1 [Chlamydomonas eustigma]|eukprot:GAX85739.1 hypothetical protein CEUSTIGMA_g13154.t1 [Chlamydomonas eustigma]
MANDIGLLGRPTKFRWNVQSATAIVMIVMFSAVYYHFILNLHLNELAAHPAVIMAMPPLTILWGLSIFPLLVFLSFQDDFRNVNPLLPSNYRDIFIKSMKAMQSNGFKIREKDM